VRASGLGGWTRVLGMGDAALLLAAGCRARSTSFWRLRSREGKGRGGKVGPGGSQGVAPAVQGARAQRG
jgi:hypothetical protein